MTLPIAISTAVAYDRHNNFNKCSKEVILATALQTFMTLRKDAIEDKKLIATEIHRFLPLVQLENFEFGH